MTAANSCIVLTEGLAPAPIAAQLLKQLPSYAPNLLNYLDRCQSKHKTLDINESKCTALELWLLEQAGFTASMAKHNAALALLLASEQQKLTSLDPNSPFWLVELVHISPARDGAALLGANELDIDATQNEALLHSAQGMCEGTPFSLSAWSTSHWQLHIDANFQLPAEFASSALVSRTAVNDWWDQDAASRDWRRFVNEIQMLYFDHPVNTTRQQQGMPPINSLWPVGGLPPSRWQPQPTNTRVINSLTASYLRQDWGDWLQQLQIIDKEIAHLLNAENPPSIVLTNTSAYLSASLLPKTLWQRFFTYKFTSTPSWRNHWQVQS